MFSTPLSALLRTSLSRAGAFLYEGLQTALTVDLMVARLQADGVGDVSREAKRDLARLTTMDMRTDKGRTPLGTCLERLTLSVARAFESGKVRLDLPLAALPLEFPMPNSAAEDAEAADDDA
ncbi:MAG TPA: hypothetical protein VNK52_03355 [Hyphomicrobiaceae bacterium]|nr:hypothetical protein [Hyphomicrobiaceae bacterium]